MYKYVVESKQVLKQGKDINKQQNISKAVQFGDSTTYYFEKEEDHDEQEPTF